MWVIAHVNSLHMHRTAGFPLWMTALLFVSGVPYTREHKNLKHAASMSWITQGLSPGQLCHPWSWQQAVTAIHKGRLSYAYGWPSCRAFPGARSWHSQDALKQSSTAIVSALIQGFWPAVQTFISAGRFWIMISQTVHCFCLSYGIQI